MATRSVGRQLFRAVIMGCALMDTSKQVRVKASLAAACTVQSLRPLAVRHLAEGANFPDVQLLANATMARAPLG